MAWVTLQYSKSQVDRAGRTLASGEADLLEQAEAFEVVNNWRAAHSFPLNTFQIGLRRRASEVYEHALVAQRLKRVPSITQKLNRFENMKLSRMQDIGGCRAVVATIHQVMDLRGNYLKARMKHVLVGQRDYIESPQESGYRSVHLVYRFTSDRTPTFNGPLIEVQLRTRLQHAWATAVETVGTFLQQALKASQGSDQWLRFFALASAAFALREGTPPVPNTPGSIRALTRELVELGTAIDARRRLEGYGNALNIAQDIGRGAAHYFLLRLQPAVGHLAVRTFRKNELPAATEAYLAEEKEASRSSEGQEVVLVSVDSLEALRRAYPNYFLDTKVFFESLSRITGRTFRRRP